MAKSHDMEDEAEDSMEPCIDLLCLEQCEPFPKFLLTQRQAGEWTPVVALCRELEIETQVQSGEIVVTWLEDPSGDDGFVIILFYDQLNYTSRAAHYNRSRLLRQSS